ncbi:hypothetical protein KAU11_10570 [Candidatus Babeliales bacterium]|nr:hypothetical protein [Candidatus Babeliales bacterium]
MGSYNPTCSVSGLTIEPGDKTVFIPLIEKSRYYGDEREETRVEIEVDSILTSNEGALSHYSPLLLPIMGVYDDYGSIAEIERDPNTEALEEMFKKDIQDVVSELLDDKKITAAEVGEIEGISGTFILREIYDKLSHNLIDAYGGERRELIYYGHVLDSFLIELGFKKMKPLSEKKRYDKGFKKMGPLSEKKRYDRVFKIVVGGIQVTLHGDGTWYRLAGMPDSTFYSLEDLDIYLKSVKIDLNFKEIFNKPSTKAFELVKKSATLRDFYRPCSSYQEFYNPYFLELYGKALRGETLKDAYTKFAIFLLKLNSLNKILFPSIYASQNNGIFFQVDLQETVIKVIKAKLKREHAEAEELVREDGDEEDCQNLKVINLNIKKLCIEE